MQQHVMPSCSSAGPAPGIFWRLPISLGLGKSWAWHPPAVLPRYKPFPSTRSCAPVNGRGSHDVSRPIALCVLLQLNLFCLVLSLIDAASAKVRTTGPYIHRPIEPSPAFFPQRVLTQPYPSAGHRQAPSFVSLRFTSLVFFYYYLLLFDFFFPSARTCGFWYCAGTNRSGLRKLGTRHSTSSRWRPELGWGRRWIYWSFFFLPPPF